MLSERAEEMEEDLVPLRERQRELTEQASGLRPTLGELEAQDEARVQGLRDQGEGGRQERASLVAGIDGRTVKEYDLIRKAKKGLGLVEIRGSRRTGCNVMLPVNVQQKAALSDVADDVVVVLVRTKRSLKLAPARFTARQSG